MKATLDLERSAQLKVSTVETQNEKFWRILRKTKKKDRRTGAEYLEIIKSDKALLSLIKRNRVPLILQQFDTWHIVFPPSAMISRRGHDQVITNTTPFELENTVYVSHTSSPDLKGPRCVCSFVTVSRETAVRLSTRIINMLMSLGRVEDARKYLVGEEIPSPLSPKRKSRI